MADPDLMLPDVVQWEAYVGDSGFYPGRDYADPVSLAAHLSHATRVMQEGGDQITVAEDSIIVEGIPGIDERDRITLPDGTQPTIREVRAYEDPEGGSDLVHTTVVFE